MYDKLPDYDAQGNMHKESLCKELSQRPLVFNFFTQQCLKSSYFISYTFTFHGQLKI